MWVAIGSQAGAVLTRELQTYMLTLPIPLAKIVPRLTLCLLKYAHGIQYKQCVVPFPSAQTADFHQGSLNALQRMQPPD